MQKREQSAEDAKLLAAIESFIVRHNVSPSYFGQRATKNSELVKRLRNGGGVTIGTRDNVYSYMGARDALAGVK